MGHVADGALKSAWGLRGPSWWAEAFSGWGAPGDVKMSTPTYISIWSWCLGGWRRGTDETGLVEGSIGHWCTTYWWKGSGRVKTRGRGALGPAARDLDGGNVVSVCVPPGGRGSGEAGLPG